MMARGEAWRIAGIGTLLAVAMGVASWTHQAEEGVRGRLLAAVVRADAMARPEVVRTSPFVGDLAEGVAQDFYAQADVAFRGTPTGLWENGASMTPERQAEVRQLWAPGFECLAQGAQRACGSHRTGSRYWDLTRLRAEVVARFAAGLPHEAIALLVVGLAVDVDQGEDSRVLLAEFEVLTDARLRALSLQDRRMLGVVLQRLDALLEPIPVPQQGIINAARSRLEAVSKPGMRLSAWRSGFDADRAELEALDELLKIGVVLQPAAADGAARQAQFAAYRRAPRAHSTPQTEWLDGMVGACEQRSRRSLCDLRLLRLSIAFHNREPLTALGDPFGSGNLEVRIDGDTGVFCCMTAPGGSVLRVAERGEAEHAGR